MFSIQALKKAAGPILNDPLYRYLNASPQKGGMSAGQRRVHESTDRLRLCVAGNQIGKTRILCAEVFMSALDCHPWRDTPPVPNLGWVMVADLTHWSNFSMKMREVEPPDVLHPDCRYDPVRGYTKGGIKCIVFNNGSIVVAKSGCQDMISLAGATLDYAIIDELPKQGHFGELKSRCAVKSGAITMSFTSIGRPSKWLQTHVEGDSETGIAAIEHWDIHRIKLSVENCPHRDPVSVQQQIDGYSPWEYAQRVDAEWQGIEVDRWITGFNEENVFTEPPEGVEEIGLSWDHGERPSNSVCYLLAWAQGRLYVLGEYTNKERNTPKAEAVEIVDMMAGWGVTPNMVTAAYGDSNSAGRLSLGHSVNSMLERAFADIVGSSRPPFDIKVPYKFKGSIKYRARLISNSCVDGSFMVHSSCTRLIESLRYWRGKNDDLKHCFDAVAYGADHWLDPSAQLGTGLMVIQ